MKHTFITLLMLIAAAAVSAAAAVIPNGSEWCSTPVVYTADVRANSKIIFTGCDEGQDMGFVLTPKAGKKDEYTVTGYNSDHENPYSSCTRAKFMRKMGLSAICFYNSQGLLLDVLTPLEFPMGQDQVMDKRTRMLKGQYRAASGDPLNILDGSRLSYDGTNYPYNDILFNSLVTGVIQVKGGSPVDGLWRVVITPEGMRLDKQTAEDEWFSIMRPTGQKKSFTWARKDVPRFQFASEILLNGDLLRGIDKSTLRVMRNEILFHHGYKPNSPDLRAYLADKQWYTPAASNDDVYNDLCFVETLNIELIKAAEETASATSQTNDEHAPTSGFDFNRYRESMLDQAEGNLNYMKSTDDIRFASYALLDIDRDGIDEVWVRDDGSQDFQGIYGCGTDGNPILIQSSDARSELRFYPGAVLSGGYYGEGEFRESVSTIHNSRESSTSTKYELINAYSNDQEVLRQDFNVKGRKATERQYDTFIESLGASYQPQVTWHNVL